MLGVGRAQTATGEAPRRAEAATQRSLGLEPLPDRPVPVHAESHPPPMHEREAWAIVGSAAGVGPVTFARLLSRFGSAARILEIARRPGGARELESAMGQGTTDGWNQERAHELAVRLHEAAMGGDRLLGQVRKLGLSILTVEDAGYPARLRAIEMPPLVLFVAGDGRVLERKHAVAVVGTRRATDAGRRDAARISGALSRSGAVVVSGLAVGIDGAAHDAAIAEHVPTAAVLGGGHAHLFPRAHRLLAERIVGDGGVIVSELRPDTKPSKWTFPRRNRIISGLADATVIVEAPEKSGALITAHWALEQGRGCYVVPGPIGARSMAGSLALLRDFPEVVRVVATVYGLLVDLGLEGDGHGTGGRCDTKNPLVPALVELGAVERQVANALVSGLATVDELHASLSLPVATLLGTLTLLEMRGLVTSAYGRYRPAGTLASGP